MPSPSSQGIDEGQVEYVTPDIIRAEFNRYKLFERVNSGELKRRVFTYDTHLNRRQRQKAGEPKCTRSQMVLYSTLDGEPVALVHQYRRPDGTIGGKGKPDPKWLSVSGQNMKVRGT